MQSKGHGKSVDWWAIGILIYEMLAGYPPFFDDNPMYIYRKILENRVEFPKCVVCLCVLSHHGQASFPHRVASCRHFDLKAKDIIRRFLNSDRSKRLGELQLFHWGLMPLPTWGFIISLTHGVAQDV